MKYASIASLIAFTFFACAKQDAPPASAQRVDTDLKPASRVSDTPKLETRSSGESTISPAPHKTDSIETASSDSITAPEPANDTSSLDSSEPLKRTPDVVFVPTPQPIVDKMLELAAPKKSDIVYDLGCGDGRIVVTAAKRYGVKAFGFDIDPERVREAKANVRANKLEHLVTIEQKDIFTIDLSPANVVTLYLLPQLNVKLIPQLEKLKPGSRVVSHDFDMAGVTPAKQLSMKVASTGRDHSVYLWNAPIKKDSGTAQPSQ